MKVLVVFHDSSYIGGASKSAYSLVKELKKTYNVEFIALFPKKNDEMPSMMENIGIPVITTWYCGALSEHRHDGKDILRYVKVYFSFYYEKIKGHRLANILKKEKIDCVYTNTRLPVIGAFIARKLNVPHVLHVREFGGEQPIWGKWDFNQINKMTDKLVVISNELRTQFIENGVNTNKILLTYDGIEYPTVNFISKSLNKNEIHLLLAGRLDAAKGHEDAIKALHIIKTQNLFSRKLKLHFAGSAVAKQYATTYVNYLKNLIKNYGLEEDVIFEGEINNLALFRAQMDIELMCSQKETLGRVTVEAMRSGLFVIGSNTGGTLDIIKDGYNGYLYEQGNAKDLACKIVKALSDDLEFNQIRSNAITFSSLNFTTKENASELYRCLCDLTEINKETN